MHSLARLYLLLALLAIGSMPATAQGPATVLQAFEDASFKLLEQAEPCVVAVSKLPDQRHLARRDPGKNVFGLGELQEPAAQGQNPFKSDFLPTEFGTGVLVAPRDKPTERYVLTNYHLVKGARTFRDPNRQSDSQLFVHLAKHQGTAATIYAADARSDLAVLKLGRLPGVAEDSLPSLRLFDGESVRKGQLVFTLGNPYALARDGSPSVSFGMISNISRLPFAELNKDKNTIHHFGTLLHVDTRLNLGMSGGALLNQKGELVGITTALAALEGYESSVGFAIPINRTTRRIAESLLSGFEVEYGFLGVQLENTELEPTSATGGMRNAVLVGRVVQGSPAAQAGLRHGDLILALNGRPVFSRDDVMRDVGLAGPGAKVVLQLRGSRTVTVSLGKWPVQETDGVIVSQDRYPAWRGVRVDWPTSRSTHTEVGTPGAVYPEGVLVMAVTPSSSAAAAPLKVGQLITDLGGRPVRTPEQFLEAAKSLRGDVLVKLADGRMVTLKP